MPENYIKNKGVMKTLIHANHHNKINEVKWNAKYDGENANIKIDLNDGKHKKHYNVKLDNDNLAELLNIPSVNTPLEKRLLRDFNKTRKTHRRVKPLVIEFDIHDSLPTFTESETDKTDSASLLQLPFEKIEEELEKEQEKEKIFTHISSPLQNEELFIPVQIAKNTPKTVRKYRRHRKYKNHRTPYTKKKYKVYRQTRRTL
jgi:hypothetical protein